MTRSHSREKGFHLTECCGGLRKVQFVFVALAIISFSFAFFNLVMSKVDTRIRESQDENIFDAIIVPAGGQLKESPSPHVVLRLEKAIELYTQQKGKKPVIITTARGTPHKPSPLDEGGFEMHESEMNARFLMSHGIPPGDILEESTSLETVGNAYFARIMHTDIMGLRRIAIINNAWHMPRTKAVFEHVFGVPPDKGYNLTFIAVGNSLEGDILEARLRKEADATPRFVRGSPWRDQTRTLQDLHKWIHHENTAYAAKRLTEKRKPIDPKLAASY